MKKLQVITGIISVIVLTVPDAGILSAQGYGGPLSYQGIEHPQRYSAVGRAMGGISVGIQQDISMMFDNPATLPTISGVQISLAGLSSSRDLNQEQNYSPVRYYANLSLFLENKTDQIPDPDPSLPGFTAQDTVQRPFDDIGPNWSRSDTDNLPLQVMLGVPVTLANIKFAVGIGAVQYAELNHFYQNNNVLSPGILAQRPLPTLRPTDDDPVEVEWMQSIRSREGSVQGYGGALSAHLEELNLALGISGMLLQGSSDDYEQHVTRGRLTFFSNAFRADSVYSRVVKSGESEYSGFEFTMAGILTGRYVSLGFTLKPPMTITRDYNMRVSTDTTGSPIYSVVGGEDKLDLPWRGTIGLTITPTANLKLGLAYDFRPYESVRYTYADGRETSPWLSASLFRFGVQYVIAPWLTLRGGMRGEAEVFEPEGNHIAGEPVRYTVYSAGVGVSIAGVRFDAAYEYALVKYEDTWASAISKNELNRYAIIGQISYEIPWFGHQ